MSQRTTALAELFPRLQRIIDQALAVRFNVTDEPGSLALAAEAAPSILALVGNATDCLIAIQDGYEELSDADAGGQGQDPSTLDDIGALISSEVAVQEILDLAFMGLAQLRLARGRLETAIDSQNLLAMVTRADSALTRLRRECIPVEAAIAEFEGRPNPMRSWADLEVSLEIRRVYANLRRAVTAVGEPTADTLPKVLADFAVRLATLGANPVYPRLRIADRVQFQTLSRRIGAWLANESERDPTSGRRLWSDLATFCHLLVEVSKRQELVEHDRQVITRAYQALVAVPAPPTLVPADLLDELHTLEGRDDELDRVIQLGASRSPAAWTPALSRLYLATVNGQPAGFA